MSPLPKLFQSMFKSRISGLVASALGIALMLGTVTFLEQGFAKPAPNATPVKAEPAKPGATSEAAAAKKPKEPSPVKMPPEGTAYKMVALLDLLKAPTQYQDQYVTFEGEFTSFASLGLDYKKVMRKSADFVSVLLRRPDVDHHTIPLAELKMFYPRDKSESVINIEPGDRITVKAHEFAVVLGEPWLDIIEMQIHKKEKPAEKTAEKAAATNTKK